MKTALRALVITATAFGIVALPVVSDTTAPQPMGVVERSVPLAFAADGREDAWVSGALESGATVVGLTWDDAADAPDGAQIRVRVAGDWGRWEDVVVDDEHGPDPGSPEAGTARGGTAPIVVEGADAVQFRVTGDAPGRVVAELVEVDDPDAHRRIESPLGAAEAAPSRPAINDRDDWNADSCVRRDPDDIVHGDRVQVLFVHHTASHTSHSRSQVPGIIRGICSYHVNGRGWDDIGYNALIDRYGGIWEGRAGGLDRHPIGAHTGGFNADSSGVAFIGDHQNGGAPTSAAQDGLRRYAAWKLDVHNVDPRGRSSIESSGSSRWSEGTVVAFDAISGHRDASSTSCPGWACYSLLDDFMLAVDRTGGVKIFGGWPLVLRTEREDGRWSQTRVDLEFAQLADWRLQVRDEDDRVIWSTTGRDVATSVRWDGRVAGGADAPAGVYTVHTTARAVSGGATATPADHVLELGLALGTFDDVDADDTFVEDIRWLAIEGVTRGCDPPANTLYCPEDVVNRGQMAAFISRAAGLAGAPHAGFVDVPRSHPFAQDIANIAAAGITRGCETEPRARFCPDAPVTRQEMAAFLSRAADLTDVGHPGFTDVPRGSTFEIAIRALATAGITRGCNPPANDRFCPTQDVTRAQMAAFIRRADL